MILLMLHKKLSQSHWLMISTVVISLHTLLSPHRLQSRHCQGYKAGHSKISHCKTMQLFFQFGLIKYPKITLNLQTSWLNHSCSGIRNLILHVQIYFVVTGGICSIENIKEIDFKTATNQHEPGKVGWIPSPNTEKKSIASNTYWVFSETKL